MKETIRYLSRRVMVLAIAQVAILILLAIGSVINSGSNAWPMMPTVAVALQIGLCVVAYFWVVRPYRRVERMVGLFLDGYSPFQSGQQSGLHQPHDGKDPVCEGRAERQPAVEAQQTAGAVSGVAKSDQSPFSVQHAGKHPKRGAEAGLSSVADMTEALAVFFRYTISKVEIW